VKEFKEIKFDLSAAATQLDAFESLLKSKAWLAESADLLPFFKANDQFVASLGLLFSVIGVPDRIAAEYDLWGDFRADVVIGDSRRAAYVVIELENAEEDSIFRKVGTKATREWSPRFEHGYSQILDWLHQLDTQRQTAQMEGRFGVREPVFTAALLIGRDAGVVGPIEKDRFAFRVHRVAVDSKKVECITFDQLAAALRDKMTIMREWATTMSAANGLQVP
jgi:hypothetical protein